MQGRRGQRILFAAAFALLAGFVAANNPAPDIAKHVDGQARACFKSLETVFGQVRHDIAA